MIVLCSTGTDYSRACLRWSGRHGRRSLVHKRPPVSMATHMLAFTRLPGAAQQEGSWKVDETLQSTK